MGATIPTQKGKKRGVGGKSLAPNHAPTKRCTHLGKGEGHALRVLNQWQAEWQTRRR